MLEGLRAGIPVDAVVGFAFGLTISLGIRLRHRRQALQAKTTQAVAKS